jgi:nucleoside-diphosphate-sugar epimerase
MDGDVNTDPTGGAVVVGGSGFVGSAVVRSFERSGSPVRAVAAPRLAVEFGADPVAAATAWAIAEQPAFDALTEALRGARAVVNAAGDAAPTSPRSAAIWGANAVLPGVIALAAHAAGATRFVHVSSAAVQGSQAELDEQPFEQGHSAYAESKGAGERCVATIADPTEVTAIVYRPTSVLGASRPIAQRLAAVLRTKWLPMPAHDVPLPVAHVDHVGDAVRFLVELDTPAPIELHPSEGMTVASLATAFGRERPFIRLPAFVHRPLLAIVGLLARGGPVAGQARRLELLWAGQRQSSSMPAQGFEIADPAAAFERLGQELLVHSAA